MTALWFTKIDHSRSSAKTWTVLPWTMTGITVAANDWTGVGSIIGMEDTWIEDRPLRLWASSGTVGKATDIPSNVPRWSCPSKPSEVTVRWRSNTAVDLRLLTKADIGRKIREHLFVFLFEEMLIYKLINPFGVKIRHNSWSNWCAYECCNRKIVQNSHIRLIYNHTDSFCYSLYMYFYLCKCIHVCHNRLLNSEIKCTYLWDLADLNYRDWTPQLCSTQWWTVFDHQRLLLSRWRVSNTKAGNHMDGMLYTHAVL